MISQFREDGRLWTTNGSHHFSSSVGNIESMSSWIPMNDEKYDTPIGWFETMWSNDVRKLRMAWNPPIWKDGDVVYRSKDWRMKSFEQASFFHL